LISVQGYIRPTFLRGCVREVLREVKYPAQVDLMILSDETIREINERERGIDQPTDVLSFPAIDWQGGETPLPDIDTGRVFLGDILISFETARNQAREYGHSLVRELGFLAVHGTLHLLGYDHQTEEERAAMRAREEAVLKRRGLQR
jgi:probable rRNA maturation factor